MISLLHFTHLSITWCTDIAFLMFTFVCEWREQTARAAAERLILCGQQMLLNFIYKLNAKVNRKIRNLATRTKHFGVHILLLKFWNRTSSQNISMVYTTHISITVFTKGPTTYPEWGESISTQARNILSDLHGFCVLKRI